jgi:hypothetical protein
MYATYPRRVCAAPARKAPAFSFAWLHRAECGEHSGMLDRRVTRDMLEVV